METRGPESYTLELLLRPTSTKSASTILAVDTPTRPRELLLRQRPDGLVVTHDDSVENDRTQSITFYRASESREVIYPERLFWGTRRWNITPGQGKAPLSVTSLQKAQTARFVTR